VAEQRVQRRLAAILVADVVGYSRLMGADEAGTHARLKELRGELLHPKVSEYGGRIVKTTGDGTLVEFPSAVDAVLHAVDIQQALTRRNADLPDDRRIEFRMGINLGDVIVEGDDIFGEGVNVAARLESLAEPGGISISAIVHESVRTKLDIGFTDLGEKSLKNIPDPVRVFSVELARSGSRSLDAASSPSMFRRPAVAVLPFENLSGDPEQEYFVDGLTEDIITALSLWRSFPVIARNSTFAYKGTSPDIRKVGEELGARYVIEGSVRKAGNRVRVTAQLINAETGHHVWAERYDRAMDDFFELQDEIANRIAAIIEPAMAKAEGSRIAAKRPTDFAAWEYCLKGFDHLGKYTREDNILARDMFTSALALDPNYARAYSGIAYTHCRDLRFGYTEDREESCRAAFAAARRAITLDDTDSQGHIMLSRTYTHIGDRESGIAEGRRALELNPHDTDALLFTGCMLVFWGEPQEGIELLERGLELNPLDPRNFTYMANLTLANLCLGDYDSAAVWGRESTRRNPEYFESHVNLASALGYLDRGEEARALLARFDDRASANVRDRVWLRQDVTDTLLEGLRKAGVPA
jgi:adenylate cyclase